MITGIILAGGKSSRFGRDKCKTIYNKKLLIQFSIEAIKPFVSEILISSNNYDLEFLGYKIIQDTFVNCGPIGGLYSCLKHSKTEKNIVIPCDMPYITTDLLQYLIYNSDNFDAVVPVFYQKIEPITAIFSKNILPIIENQIKHKNYKILSLLNLIKTHFITIDEKLPFYTSKLFKNINYLNDLEQ
jgi:molybdopterin-guanine dinucleotide biosynthesis protein A